MQRRADQTKKMSTAKKGALIAAIVMVGYLLTVTVTNALYRLPFLQVTPKQYVVSGNAVAKQPVPSLTVQKSAAEIVAGAADTKDADVLPGDEFAQWAVLDYQPGGYRVIYPYGFAVSYTPARFEASAPGGGKVIVTVENSTFSVSIEENGNAKQALVLQAAKRLIQDSFEFTTATASP